MQQKPKEVAIFENAVITIGNLGVTGATAIGILMVGINEDDRELGI